MVLSALAQVSSKNANTCIISPFDNSQIEMIEKSLKIWDDSLEIKRGQVELTVTQMSQGK
jgi:ribosome recycling factor